MPKLQRSSSFRSSPNRSPIPVSPQRSPTASPSSHREAELEFPDSKKWPKVHLSSDESDSDDSDEDIDASAKDLLAAAKGRMEQQKLMDELKQARLTIAQRATEIQQLKGQVQMAICTKRDLVMANQDLEIQHQVDLHELSLKECDLRRSSFHNIELRADIEKEFMNELTELSLKVERAESRRIEELKEKDKVISFLRRKLSRMDDLIEMAQRISESEEALVRECDGKDELIQALQEKIRHLEHQRDVAARPEPSKLTFAATSRGSSTSKIQEFACRQLGTEG